MIILEVVMTVMSMMYTVLWYTWAIGYYLGYNLCYAILYIGKFCYSFSAAIPPIIQDFYSFVMECQQAYVFIGDMICGSFSNTIQSIGEFVISVYRFIGQEITDVAHQSRMFLKYLIHGICINLCTIREGIQLIADCILWSAFFIPRLIWYSLSKVLNTTTAACIYLKKTVVPELMMVTDMKFLVSVAVITVFVVILQCKWPYNFTAKYLNIIKDNKIIRMLRSLPKTIARAIIPRRDAQGTAFSACVVCQEQPKTTLLLPCKHLCLCGTCIKIMAIRNISICPLCRRDIDYFIHVYI